LVVLFLLFVPVSNTHGPANEQSLKTLVAAVKQYRADYGGYPASLRQLTPKYVASIPSLRGDVAWDYHIKPDGEIYLSFLGEGAEWTGSYSSERDSIVIDDK
jgi:hypothetical protein